jgi:hypothetical protein
MSNYRSPLFSTQIFSQNYKEKNIWSSPLSVHASAIARPPHEPEYVIPCVDNLTERISFLVYLNFPPAYEYRKYTANIIH